MSTPITTDAGGCAFCPDGHAAPASRPFSAWVSTHRDGDGQPTEIIVATSNGAHVAESDAQWVRELLNAHAPQPAPALDDLEQDEPMSLADLADLIRQTAEAADTLLEHAGVLRHSADDAAHGVELHAIGSDLGMAWAYLQRAMCAAYELAAAQR